MFANFQFVEFNDIYCFFSCFVISLVDRKYQLYGNFCKHFSLSEVANFVCDYVCRFPYCGVITDVVKTGQLSWISSRETTIDGSSSDVVFYFRFIYVLFCFPFLSNFNNVPNLKEILKPRINFPFITCNYEAFHKRLFIFAYSYSRTLFF